MSKEEAAIIVGNLPIIDCDDYSISEYQEAKAIAIDATLRVDELERAFKEIEEKAEFYKAIGNMREYEVITMALNDARKEITK